MMSRGSKVVGLGLAALIALACLGSTQASATIYCTGGPCYGGPAENWMIGTDGWDLIESYDGRDHIWGMPTGDDLHGGADGDIIYGNPGNDVIRGQNGNDWVLCNVDDCGLDGGNGDDEIHGWVGTDVLIGGPGNDEMYGDDQPDRLYARDGQKDFVNGGDANDFCQVDNIDFYQWC